MNQLMILIISNMKIKSKSNQEQQLLLKIIQIKQFQEDPMLPPKFKLRKNRHERIIEDVTFVKDLKTKN